MSRARSHGSTFWKRLRLRGLVICTLPVTAGVLYFYLSALGKKGIQIR